MSKTKQRQSFLAAMIALCASLPTAARSEPTEGQKVIIAVFALQAPETSIKSKKLAALRSALEADLVQTGRYSVVAESDMRSAIASSKRESFDECFDESCQIELGKEVAAQAVLSSRVTKLGEDCEVTLKLYALKEAAASEAASATDECDASGVRRSLRAAAYQLAGVAPKKRKASIRFETVDLPRVDMPSFETETTAELDFADVDVDALELYDRALSLDKKKGVSVKERIAIWREVAKKTKKFRRVAKARIRTWKQFEREQARADAARQKFEAQRSKDFKKLSRLLKLKVVTEADKQDWAVAFIEAYGGRRTNPFAKDRLLTEYLARAAWPKVAEGLVTLSSDELRLGHVRRFLRRYPKYIPAVAKEQSLQSAVKTAKRAAREAAQAQMAQEEQARKRARLEKLLADARRGVKVFKDALNSREVLKTWTRNGHNKRVPGNTFYFVNKADFSLTACRAEMTFVNSSEKSPGKRTCSGAVSLRSRRFFKYKRKQYQGQTYEFWAPSGKKPFRCVHTRNRRTSRGSHGLMTTGVHGYRNPGEAALIAARDNIARFCSEPAVDRALVVPTKN